MLLNVKGQIVKSLARPGNRSDKLFPHLAATVRTISPLTFSEFLQCVILDVRFSFGLIQVGKV